MITFDEIVKRLSPFANRSWLKRFEQTRNRGPKIWLTVVRDFDVQSPEVEYAVNDVVRELDTLQPHKSLVRAEMEKLEASGKLHLDTPEEEAHWEKLLEEERLKHQAWKKDENETYLKQKKMDLEFLRKKEQGQTPIASTLQDPKKNEAINPVVPEEQQLKKDAPAMPEPDLPPPVSDEEKKQAAFVPKPPPEKEAPVLPPKMKSIEVEGKEVYNAGKTTAPKQIDKLEGMPEDAAKRLKEHGIATEEAFKTMDRAQARKILGEPLYRRFEKTITS
jgi:acyl transferase domain-containing protein